MTDKWKNRRRMAWCALIASLIFPLAAFFADSAQLTAISMPFYMFTSAVVGAYIGFATADDKWQKKDEV